MQPWAAISIIVIMGVFLLVQLVIIHNFGEFTKVITKTYREVLELRMNIVLAENDRAALAALHSRRYDDVKPEQQKEA